LTRPTLPTLKAVATIHKAHNLSFNKALPEATKVELRQLTDAVLSFTSFYLRFAEPECRPEQLEAYERLRSKVNLLEQQLENNHECA